MANKKPAPMFGYTAAQYKKFKHYAWAFLLSFSVLYMCTYCTRLNLANAASPMMDTLNWTTSDIGILTSTLFWTYGFGQLINGRLGEVVGSVRLVTIGVFGSIICNILLGLQSSLFFMSLIWACNGFFQSMGWTCGISTLTKWWPGNTRGFAVGFLHAFSGFGQAAATTAVALAFTLFPDMGWQAAFFVPAVLPALLYVIFRLVSKASPEQIGLPEYTEADPEKAAAEAALRQSVKENGVLYPYKYLFSRRAMTPLLFVGAIMGVCRYGLVTWIPLYFIQVFNVQVTSGLFQSLTLPLGMAIGTFVIPWLTDFINPKDRMPVAAISAALTGVFVLFFFLLDPSTLPGLVLTELCLFFTGFFQFAVGGVSSTLMSEIGGRVFSGTAAGLYAWAAYMGAAIQSIIFGFVLSSGGWNALFISIIVFSLLAAGLIMLARKISVEAQS